MQKEDRSTLEEGNRSYFDRKLIDFLHELASSKPTPGGGGAGALAGALAAALVSMVANLTDEGEGEGKGKAALKGVEEEATDLYRYFLEGIGADASVFENLLEAYRSSSPGETEIDRALKKAIETPLCLGRAALKALDLSYRCAASGKKELITDAAAAAHLAETALQIALLNVEINLKGMEEGDYARSKGEESDELERKGRKKHAATIAKVEERIKG